MQRAIITLISMALLVAAMAPTSPAVMAAKPKCDGRVATIVGTDKAETIRGTKKADVIVARAGADIIHGRGGKDVVCGGGGRDTIRGGWGGDTVYGGSGDDTIYGGDGRDILYGGEGEDTINGGNGGDTINGGTAADVCNGGAGIDWLRSCNEPATTGAMTITTDTTLTAPHKGWFDMAANDVTLDCDGHTITGPGRRSGVFGISLFQRTGLTVRNCDFRYFNSAFLLKQSHGNTFTDNRMSHLRQGFTLQDSDGNKLIANRITDANDYFGIGILDGSDDNRVRDNVATKIRGIGFLVWEGTRNVFTRNIARGGAGTGFVASLPAKDNTFKGNSAIGNTGWGMQDNTTGGTGDRGTDNDYTNNTCRRNGAGAASPRGLC